MIGSPVLASKITPLISFCCCVTLFSTLSSLAVVIVAWIGAKDAKNKEPKIKHDLTCLLLRKEGFVSILKLAFILLSFKFKIL